FRRGRTGYRRNHRARSVTMTLYNVHIYREMRLYFPGIEAQSPHEAARIAADKPTDEAALIEDCEGQTLAALVDVAGDECFEQSQIIDFDLDIHELLMKRRQIGHIWGVEDVHEVRPDLTDEQAWEVLQEVDRHKDCDLGISWATLEILAEQLFGDAPETDEAEERP